MDVGRKLMKLGCWHRVYETWMLIQRLWKLDVDRKFMNLGCWQKVYETSKLTESLWNFDVDRKFKKLGCWQKVKFMKHGCWNKDCLSQLRHTDWTMSISKLVQVVQFHAWLTSETCKKYSKTFCQN